MVVPFSAMTWNVENLFSPGGEYGPPTQEIFDRKLDNIAAVVTEIASDVLALQELGDDRAFAALQDRLAGAYPHRAISFAPDRRGIRVGFLSRLPFARVSGFVDFPGGGLRGVPGVDGRAITRLGRGALLVAVEPADGLRVNLVTAHLKSKLVSYPGGRRQPFDESEEAWAAGEALILRAAEAVALRQFTIHLTKGGASPLLLLGDLNDVVDAATNQILTGPPDLDLSRRDKGDDTRLYNLANLIPPERRFSRVYRGEGELIDHILVSRELVSPDPARQPTVDIRTDLIVSITEDVERRREATIPDHAPVFARFEIETG
jgi:endonuclease/exonuclease/phosphatase family metal-dependent hydrolase